jgi:hypothetical protein
MAYLPPTTHVTLLGTVQRERLLSMPGEVIVTEHQRVEATDIVARAYVADKHSLVNVAEALGVPDDKIDQYMVKDNGQAVKKGELLAVRKTALGIGTKRLSSPVDGELIVAGDGKALLGSFSQPVELRAGMPGTVLRVHEGRGVTLETAGALVSGVWGNGKEDFAVMRVVGSSPTAALLTEQIDMGLRGMIVAAGILQDLAAFKQMAEVRIRGLVLGSMKADLIPAVQRLEFPVLVTDGFGVQGFSPAVYGLLVTNTGRETWVNAQAWDRFAGHRPEAFIPLPSPGQSPPTLVEGDPLAPGKRVRITRGSEAGRSGTVVALSDRAALLPDGGRARVATVEFEQVQEALLAVPFANLEILE